MLWNHVMGSPGVNSAYCLWGLILVAMGTTSHIPLSNRDMTAFYNEIVLHHWKSVFAPSPRSLLTLDSFQKVLLRLPQSNALVCQSLPGFYINFEWLALIWELEHSPSVPLLWRLRGHQVFPRGVGTPLATECFLCLHAGRALREPKELLSVSVPWGWSQTLMSGCQPQPAGARTSHRSSFHVRKASDVQPHALLYFSIIRAFPHLFKLPT